MIEVRRLDSGYWHVRSGSQWSQPPIWPCDEETFRAHAFQDPDPEFVIAAMKLAEVPVQRGKK